MQKKLFYEKPFIKNLGIDEPSFGCGDGSSAAWGETPTSSTNYCQTGSSIPALGGAGSGNACVSGGIVNWAILMATACAMGTSPEQTGGWEAIRTCAGGSVAGTNARTTTSCDTGLDFGCSTGSSGKSSGCNTGKSA